MENTIKEVDFTKIARATLDKKTIIFTGPELTVNFGKPDNMVQSFQKIVTDCPTGLTLNYRQNDNFMIFGDKRSKIYGVDKMVAFFSSDFKNPAVNLLSEIPFHLLVNTTPDNTITQTFTDKNFLATSNFYNYLNQRVVDSVPSTENPFIYNIFGSINDVESTIFSYSDLFAYIKSLNAYEFLPGFLKDELKKHAEHILFLGIDFEKWYYQILLNILKLDVDPCFQYAVSGGNPDHTFKTLYENHFQITFINNNVQEFIQQLHAAFKPEQLRKPAEAAQVPKKYLKNNMIRFLSAAYNATDFETLCLLNFEEVHNDFTPEQSQTSRINKLLEYVIRTQSYDKLLSAGKEDNPVQFERYMPYFE